MSSESFRSLLLAAFVTALLPSLVNSALAQTQGRLKNSGSFQRCLPAAVAATQIVVYGGPGRRNVTVARMLTKLKARCSGGRLLDAKKKEIRFFKKTCWGHPPPNYLELQEEERRKLALLQTSYSVIVIECDPRLP